MKTLVTLGLLAFLCLLYRGSAGPLGPQLVKDGYCCVQNKPIKTPKATVKQLKMSPSHCKLNSLIVTTQKNVNICIDATWSWAQTLLEDFNNRNNASTKLSPSKHHKP